MSKEDKESAGCDSLCLVSSGSCLLFSFMFFFKSETKPQRIMRALYGRRQGLGRGVGIQHAFGHFSRS